MIIKKDLSSVPAEVFEPLVVVFLFVSEVRVALDSDFKFVFFVMLAGEERAGEEDLEVEPTDPVLSFGFGCSSFSIRIPYLNYI